jgi:hypothetical protein
MRSLLAVVPRTCASANWRAIDSSVSKGSAPASIEVLCEMLDVESGEVLKRATTRGRE